MALKECKECGKEVSSKAAACPHCGNPMKKAKSEATQLGCGTVIVVCLFGWFAYTQFISPLISTPQEKAVQQTDRQIDKAPPQLNTQATTQKPATSNKSVSKKSLIKLSQSDYGEKWPLTVESGFVKCLPLGAGAVVFMSEGNTYAINGIAKGFAKQKGFKDIDKIWKYAPTYYKAAVEDAKLTGKTVEEVIKIKGGLPKINISPVIEAGLKLCR